MKRLTAWMALISFALLLGGCGTFLNPYDPFDDPEFVTTSPIIGHHAAHQSVLRSIPSQYIDAARNNLHVAYQHTSHGHQVSVGMYGLPGFRSGDETAFAISVNAGSPVSGKLDWHDNNLGTPYSDLSGADGHWDAWVQSLSDYLDNTNNADINVMMWSWCSISGHNVQGYLSAMQTLIDRYGPGGSRIGTGPGKTRSVPVTFIFMTGHAESDNNVGNGLPREQARLITEYCNQHHYYCLDYYSIDTHDMSGVYHEDAGDNGDLSSGANFYQAWQNAHALGTDWFENRNSPGGSVVYGDHNTQHITANRKAFAMWYILARIAGWNGVLDD